MTTKEPVSVPVEKVNGMEVIMSKPATEKAKGNGNGKGDLFAERDGKTLTWSKVNMTLASNKEGVEDRKLLDSVWGEVPAKQTTAIMGPSGAGKTSLLNILAGRSTTRGRITISADVRLNNYIVDPSDIQVRQQIAFVAQDDSLPHTSTPREALAFSARLRLPRSTTDEDITDLTDRMLAELGLEECADTIIGGALIKGISGGERKRTSVGVELVTKPPLVFLDEPTSGLDSFSAVQLCEVLKKVANSGASVLFTIHQPSSEIFNSFDHLILMSKGRVMYQGSVPDIPDYFAERNHPVPMYYNAADHIMSVAQIKDIKMLEENGFFPKDKRELPEPLDGMNEAGRDALGLTQRSEIRDGGEFIDMRRVSIWIQSKLLFTREFIALKRDMAAIGVRFGITIFLSVLIGIIFWDVGGKDPSLQPNVQSRWGALITMLLMAMFGTADDALLEFPAQRPIFLREYSTNHYNIVPYFLSRLSVEAFLTFTQILVMSLISYYMINLQMAFIPFLFVNFVLSMVSAALAVALGGAVDEVQTATEMLPLLFVPQMLFAGFFVATDLIPSWLRWAQYLCSLTYSLRIAVLKEFDDCEPAEKCLDVIDSMDADDDEIWWYWLILLMLFLVFRILALGLLTYKSTQFY